jgi:hypothetical protein
MKEMPLHVSNVSLLDPVDKYLLCLLYFLLFIESSDDNSLILFFEGNQQESHGRPKRMNGFVSPREAVL